MFRFATLSILALCLSHTHVSAQSASGKAAIEVMKSVEFKYPYYATIRDRYPDTFAEIVKAAERNAPMNNLEVFQAQTRVIVDRLIKERALNASPESLVRLVENTLYQQRQLIEKHPNSCADILAQGRFDPKFDLIEDFAAKESDAFDFILKDTGKNVTQPMAQDEFDQTASNIAAAAANDLHISFDEFVLALRMQGAPEHRCPASVNFLTKALQLPIEKRDPFLHAYFAM